MNTTNIEIVVDPYSKYFADHLKKSLPGLKGMVVKGDWNQKCIGFIKENNIEALYLNYAWGWTETDYDFLNNLENIKQLEIIAQDTINLNSISTLRGLNYLNLDIKSKVKETIDFSQLTHLKKASFMWDDNFIDIFNCKSLVSLSTLGAKHVKPDLYGQMVNLEELIITSSNIEHLEFLTRLPKLKKLELYNCKKIMDFTPISQCEQLEWLAIEGNNSINNIDFIKHLDKIYYLNISNNKEIVSIKVLEKLENLKALAFTDNTIIEDGDLSCLTKLPNLSMLMFNPRRHYTHKLIKNWNWNNLDNPDILLNKK